jgi:hypothetical protein
MELLTDLLRITARLCSRAQSAILGVFCVVLLPAIVAGAEPLEYAVKAAYLSKFGLYVEWPGKVFSSPNSPMNLCVVGEDPFGTLLDEAVSNQRIGGRAIIVRRLKTMARDSGCHIVFIGNAEAQRNIQTVELLYGSSVLTVTDTGRQGAVTGMINFVIKDNRVRFDIDEEAAAQSGLTISSKLLSLALNVKPRH